MLCPVCGVDLLVVEYRGIDLDLCVECRGTWFDAEELDMLGASDDDDGASAESIEAALAALPSRPSGRRVRCPRCARRMREVEAVGGTGPVEVDLCPEGDGIWFDRGELERLLSGSTTEDDPALALLREFLDGFASPDEEGD